MVATLGLVTGCYDGLTGHEGPMSGPGSDSDSPTTTTEDPDHGGPQPACAETPARIWKLTPEQYDNTISALVPGATGFGERLHRTIGAPVGFSNNAEALSLPQSHVEELMAISREVAELAISGGAYPMPCSLEQMAEPRCIEQFVPEFGAKAFRRPLRPEEIEELTGLFSEQATAYGHEVALQQLVRSILMSPEFLFRTELGDPERDGGVTPLTSFEVASALSYMISNRPPDAALMEAAEQDELVTSEQIEAHARRLLSDESAASGILQFFREYTELESLAEASKSAEVYPQWSPELGAAMAEEVEQFIRYVLWEDRGDFASLHTSPGTRVNEAMAAFYGLDAPTGDDWSRVDALPDERVGLLARAGLLARLARDDESDITKRGAFIRGVMLCQTLPLPEGDVDIFPPPPDEDLTHRERLLEHMENPDCASCHTLMDPLAFPLEVYDGIGAHRLEDNGRPIDTQGEINGVASGSVEVANADELSAWFARSQEARVCFAEQAFSYSMGLPLFTREDCQIEDARQAFTTGDGDIAQLLVDIVTGEDFIYRAR